MHRALLGELQRHRSYPSVTILVSTTPGPTMAPDDVRALEQLVHSAGDRLFGDVAESVRKEMMDTLDDLVAVSVERASSNALALFVSPEHSALVRLADPVRNRVVIDETFATRDLVADAQRSAQYRLVTVSDHMSRLFLGDRSRLVEVFDDRWPLERVDESASLWARNMSKAIAAEHAEHRLPIVIAGVDRVARDVVNRARIETAGFVNGNHDRSSWRHLHGAAWPIVSEWIADEDNVMNQLDRARSARRFAGGVHEVWDLASSGRVELLVVEDSYEFPARMVDGRLQPADDATAPGVIDDAVDELIEGVLRQRGRVAIVQDGSLGQHDRVAAVLRY